MTTIYIFTQEHLSLVSSSLFFFFYLPQIRSAIPSFLKLWILVLQWWLFPNKYHKLLTQKYHCKVRILKRKLVIVLMYDHIFQICFSKASIQSICDIEIILYTVYYWKKMFHLYLRQKFEAEKYFNSTFITYNKVS